MPIKFIRIYHSMKRCTNVKLLSFTSIKAINGKSLGTTGREKTVRDLFSTAVSKVIQERCQNVDTTFFDDLQFTVPMCFLSAIPLFSHLFGNKLLYFRCIGF